MSIANGTTHYDYPQVELTDRPTFADFNPAFRDIDAKLYGLITGATTDHAAIESLQSSLGETDTLLATVKTTADGAKAEADANAENIATLTTGLSNTNRDVANKLYSVAIAEPYDATAGTYAIGDVVVYNGQRYVCTTAVAVAEPFDADKWTGEDVETVLENLATAINSVNTGLISVDQAASYAKTHVEVLDTDVYSAGVSLVSADITTPQALTPAQALANFNTIKVRLGAYYSAQDRNMYMQAFDIDLRHLAGSEDEFIYSWYLSPTNFMSVAFGINMTTGKIVVNDIRLGTDTAQTFAVYVEAYGYKQTL